MGLTRPGAGSAHIFGLDCQARAVEVKRLVGYVPGELPEFGGLRGREVVAYLGAMAGRIDPAWVADLSARLQLDLASPYRNYSRGNKQKLALLLAFLPRPRLLILDEPTGGLDPLNQQAFYALLQEATGNGATVFLSSHILSEVERVCDRVGIIRDGRLATVARLDALRAMRFHRVEITFAGPVPLEALGAAEGVEGISTDGPRVRCLVRGSFDSLLRALPGSGVAELTSREPSLEESFLQYYTASRPDRRDA